MAGIVSFEKIEIGSFFTGLGQFFKDIRTAITGKSPIDPAKAAEIEMKLLELQQKGEEIQQALMLAQMKINEIEAASPSLFKGGWRPATGWLCVTGLAWQIFVWPIWVWAAEIWILPQPPAIETAVLITLLLGMLGLGTLRTVEKAQGKESK